MRSRLILFFGFALSIVVACMGPRMEGDDPYRLQKVSDLELCTAFGGLENSLWGNISRDRLEDELHRRDLLTKDEWILVRDRRIGKGMSLCSLMASWGPGSSSYFEEGSSSFDKIANYNYQSCRTCPRIRVDTVGGTVEGWSFPGNNETYPKKID